MSDNFIRYIDNSAIWRPNDEIVLAISRMMMNFDNNSTSNDWKKGGDPTFIRRPDNALIDHSSDDPAFVREDDDPSAERDEDNDPLEIR